MWARLLFILPIICVSSIRVPVDYKETASETLAPEGTQNTPVYYISDDANVDSYLIPPSPHKPDESVPEIIVGQPSTILLPPSKEKQTDYYVPKDPYAQSDWLPIEAQPQIQNKRNAFLQQRLPLEAIPIFFNPNPPNRAQVAPLHVPIPSTRLEPPAVDAVNEFFLEVPDETEVTLDESDEPIEEQDYLPVQTDKIKESLVRQQLPSAEPTLALHLTPPKPQSLNAPTKLYPKKYSGGFKPVPIPISEFVEQKPEEIPKAKPVKFLKPQSSVEVLLTPEDEKKLFNYQKAEHQRKLKGQQEEAIKQQQLSDGAAEETHGRPSSAEQETSETNFRYPGRNTYPAPLRQAPPPQSAPAAAAPDGRTEFRMHGMKGPHSYQFGYDTGKGKNRQFRYEERDNDGLVKGHYGYMDRAGKLRVVNYSAHPEYGFRAEEPVEKQP